MILSYGIDNKKIIIKNMQIINVPSISKDSQPIILVELHPPGLRDHKQIKTNITATVFYRQRLLQILYQNKLDTNLSIYIIFLSSKLLVGKLSIAIKPKKKTGTHTKGL
jgi:hypothetical protein